MNNFEEDWWKDKQFPKTMEAVEEKRKHNKYAHPEDFNCPSCGAEMQSTEDRNGLECSEGCR